MKVRSLAAMLEATGHHPIVYSGEDHEGAGEHVTVATRADQHRWFGDTDWTQRVFDRWDVDNDPCWVEFNTALVSAIRARAQPGDVISLTMGRAHQAVADSIPEVQAVELGIGYEGIIPNGFHVFESYAWMHQMYGRYHIDDGRYFDSVIPNAFDPTELTYSETPDDYVLYLGRHTLRKGMAVVQELAKHTKVITAGQDGPLDGIEWRGVVTGREKAELLAGAKAVLMPTAYIEPFGGVAIEAMMSGVPVITTDWGAFIETVEPGVSGYRCRTLGEFLTALKDVEHLDRATIRAHALARWSLDAVAPLYDDYLTRLATLDGEGWYTRD